MPTHSNDVESMTVGCIVIPCPCLPLHALEYLTATHNRDPPYPRSHPTPRLATRFSYFLRRGMHRISSFAVGHLDLYNCWAGDHTGGLQTGVFSSGVKHTPGHRLYPPSEPVGPHFQARTPFLEYVSSLCLDESLSRCELSTRI